MTLGLGIFGTIVIGLLAGWIAKRFFNRHQGLVTNLIVGVLGGFIGGAILRAFGVDTSGGNWIFALLAATAGAVILLPLVEAVTGKSELKKN